MCIMVYQITGNSTVCLTVCLTNIKENIKACVAGEGNPPVTGGFPSQRASNTDAFSCDETITLTNDEVAFQMNHRWSSRMHYNDVIMGAMASQITNLTIVYSIVYAVADQRKHQRSASLDFVREFTGAGAFHAQMASNAEMFPFDDVIMPLFHAIVSVDKFTYTCPNPDDGLNNLN